MTFYSPLSLRETVSELDAHWVGVFADGRYLGLGRCWSRRVAVRTPYRPLPFFLLFAFFSVLVILWRWVHDGVAQMSHGCSTERRETFSTRGDEEGPRRKETKEKSPHPVMNYSNKQRMNMPLFSYDPPSGSGPLRRGKDCLHVFLHCIHPPPRFSPSSLLCHSYLAKNIA